MLAEAAKEKQTFTETTVGGKTVYQGDVGKFDYTYIKGDGVIILTTGTKKEAEDLIARPAVGRRALGAQRQDPVVLPLGYDRQVTRDPNRPVREAWIVEAVRTPIGRYGGALASVRPDDLAASSCARSSTAPGVDPALVEDVILGCANQAGEDNRDVARMACCSPASRSRSAG